jgi:Raf kinase inhibitor-like YbhB/YbcL family protein
MQTSGGRPPKGTRFEVTSQAFREGERIPDRYTAEGGNVSPPLHWGEPPSETQSFAVLCEDPDAPSGVFLHWTLWNLAADERQLQEGVPSTADSYHLRQGQNGFGGTGYSGPKPPPGKPHRYVFHVYALDARPNVTSGATREEFDRAIERHVVGEGVLSGVYGH